MGTLEQAKKISNISGFSFFKEDNLNFFGAEIVSDILYDDYFVIHEFLYDVDENDNIFKVCEDKKFVIYEVNWKNGFVCKASSEVFDSLSAAILAIPEIRKKNLCPDSKDRVTAPELNAETIEINN